MAPKPMRRHEGLPYQEYLPDVIEEAVHPLNWVPPRRIRVASGGTGQLPIHDALPDDVE